MAALRERFEPIQGRGAGARCRSTRATPRRWSRTLLEQVPETGRGPAFAGCAGGRHVRASGGGCGADECCAGHRPPAPLAGRVAAVLAAPGLGSGLPTEPKGGRLFVACGLRMTRRPGRRWRLGRAGGAGRGGWRPLDAPVGQSCSRWPQARRAAAVAQGGQRCPPRGWLWARIATSRFLRVPATRRPRRRTDRTRPDRAGPAGRTHPVVQDGPVRHQRRGLDCDAPVARNRRRRAPIAGT